ncbi:hypothetical protein ScPMuIL_016188 [Solemya velum]
METKTWHQSIIGSFSNMNEPAPPYTGPNNTFPQPGGVAPVPSSEPPPAYEPPKAGYGALPGSGYPPQGGYQAMTNPAPVYTQPVIVIQNSTLGQNPKNLQCPYCQANIVTVINYDTGTLTWLSAGLFCLVGCWLGCCLLPFCINDLQDVRHTCPNCSQLIGVYRRLD